jgi:hypothetical protein
MITENLFISYPLQSIDYKNVVKTPFKITVRTGELENKCKEQFPDLMTATIYNQDQLIRLQQMKRFIKASLKKKDLDNIHTLFYTGRYLYPLSAQKFISQLTLTDYDCKIWTNNEPRLELSGYITVSMDDIFKYFYDSKIIKLKHNKKLIKQEIQLFFSKSLPLMIIYERSTEFKSKIIELIKKLLADKNSYLFKDLAHYIKNPHFIDLTKEITWFGLETINISMNDLSENIINKLKNNKGKLAFGYLLYKSLKNK